MAKKPSTYDKGKPESEGECKKKKQDDWNYLKQTLKSNNLMNQGADGDGEGGEQLDQNLLTFHEKADELIDEQEEFRGKHFEYLKEVAKLLTEEGDLVSNVQGFGEADYDMDEYVLKMDKIIKRNLEIYGDL